MYAVIVTGGKQLKVEVGSTIYVEKLKGQKGDSVKFDKVLFVSDEKKTKVGNPLVEGAFVSGEILKQGKEKKIRVLRYHAKSNVRVHRGHRQPYTAVNIKEIKF